MKRYGRIPAIFNEVMIIQNFDSVFLKFTDTVKECFFPQERLSDTRVIDYFFINPDFNMLGLWDPYGSFPMSRATDGTPLISLPADGYYEHLRDYDGILDIFSADQKHIIDKCSVFDFLSRNNFPFYPLHSTIDPSLSKVKFAPYVPIPEDSGTADKGALNVGLFYCNEEKNPSSLIVKSRSFFVQIDSSQSRIYLKDFTKLGLKGEKVKKIIVHGVYISPDVPTDKYITIKTYNGREINELPLGFLCEYPLTQVGYTDPTFILDYKRDLNDIFFDDLEIDEDNSYIDNPCGSGFQGTLTFYY